VLLLLLLQTTTTAVAMLDGMYQQRRHLQ